MIRVRGMAGMAAAIAAALLGGCLGGGSSSETEGLRPPGVAEAEIGAGSVAGGTDPGNRVGLYAAYYHPYKDSGYRDSAVADARGGFAFRNLAAGEYNLVVTDPRTGKRVLLAALAVSATGRKEIRSGKLTVPGSLRGAIRDTLPLVSPLWVYMRGTPFTAPVGTDGAYAFTDLPPGPYALQRFWRHLLPCPNATCGGIEERSDSTPVIIEPGVETIQPP